MTHHSAAQYGFGQTVKIQGVVKELRIANPHTALFLEVKDARAPEWSSAKATAATTCTGAAGGYVKNFVLGDGTAF